MQAGKGSVELRRYPKSHPFAQLQVGCRAVGSGRWPSLLHLAPTLCSIDDTMSWSCCLPVLTTHTLRTCTLQSCGLELDRSP